MDTLNQKEKDLFPELRKKSRLHCTCGSPGDVAPLWHTEGCPYLKEAYLAFPEWLEGSETFMKGGN